MNTNKRVSKNTVTNMEKKSRLEVYSGPLTRSKSKEKLARTENKENMQPVTQYVHSTRTHSQPSILKKCETDTRAPLTTIQNQNIITSKLSIRQSTLTAQKTVQKSRKNIRTTSNEPIINSVTSLVTLRDLSRNNNESNKKLIPTENSIEQQQAAHVIRNVTLRNGKNETDKEFIEYLNSISTEDLDKPGSSKSFITYTSLIDFKSSISEDHTPFRERSCSSSSSSVIIHDGIPSLRKKTLKKDVLKPSGYAGVIDLDPNIVKVHPNILYAEFLNEIMLNYFKNEIRYVLPKDFVKKISKILHPRAMLVNWLLKIQQYYKSDTGSFFSCVRMFDTLLNITDVPNDHIQLVGIVTYWIVMKFNDIICAPKAPELVQLCRREITTEEVLQTEQKILRLLKFDIPIDEPMVCVRYYIYKMQLQDCNIIAFCANYLLECFILDGCSNTYPLSLQAAAVVYLSLQLLDYDMGNWERLNNTVGYYKPSELAILQTKIIQMMQLVQDPEYEFREPFLKYRSEKYGSVSVKLLKKQIAT